MLVPKIGRARIEALDVIRGIAILLIFFMNIPGMGNTVFSHFDPRLLGWQPIDQVCYWFLNVAISGTQRGLLQLLFGAGAIILLERTMAPDGPVEVADLYFRRTLWLMAFGLFDIFALFWFGDILLIYAIAALFLFPLRRLRAGTLIALALLGLMIPGALGVATYQEAGRIEIAATQAVQKQAGGKSLDEADRQALAARGKQQMFFNLSLGIKAEEQAAHSGTLEAYGAWYRRLWFREILPMSPSRIFEAFTVMLLGMGLFKLGIIQGVRTARFYLVLTLLAYIPGLTLRAITTWQQSDFQASPDIGMITASWSRVLVTLGHVALINLMLRSEAGQAVLSPFKAAGRTAFSLYLMQNFLGMWVLFPGFGFGLWGRFGWVGLMLIASAVIAVQVILANLWLHWFAMGPLEWLWRSLVHIRPQPFRHRKVEFVGNGLPA